MCCDGASARKRGTEKTYVCVYLCVPVYMWVRGCTCVCARQSVGAYGDPAALDEWVENQGRSEDLRESAHSREMRSCVSLLFNISSNQG